jgi:hypothetical protein
VASRHHRPVIRALQIAGASLVVLDVVLYFALFRPTQDLLISEHQQFAALRRRIYDDEARIERLVTFLAALPDAQERLTAFQQDHTPPRRQAYSDAAKLVRQVADASGAQLAGVAFKLDTKPAGPLLRLAMEIKASGTLPALLKFAHGLETASDMMVFRNFFLALNDKGELELRLDTDLYLTP